MTRFVTAICLAIIIFTSCGAFNPANADDGPAKIWSLSKVEIYPEGGDYNVTTASGGTIICEATETSILYYRSEPGTPPHISWGGVKVAGDPAFSDTKRFDFSPAPETLVPGEVATISVTGQYTFTGSEQRAAGTGTTLRAVLELTVGEFTKYKSNYVVWPDGSQTKRIEVHADTEALPKSYSFTVPAEVTADKEVVIKLSTLGRQVLWRYRAIPKVSLSLDYSPPLVSFEPGMGTDLGFAGEMVATLKDGDGKGIEGKTIIFFIDKEVPGANEPGKNLFDVLAYEATEMKTRMGDGVVETHPVLTKQLILPLDPSLHGGDRIFIGNGVKTDSNGEAVINLIEYGIIDPQKFSGELVRQRNTFLEDGKISGTVIAGVYDEETEFIVPRVAMEVEYRAMAIILDITGNEFVEEQKALEELKIAYNKVHPELKPWRPGRVRLHRFLTHPVIDYDEVGMRTELMPGDVLDIDGGVTVEIAWITGEKVSVKIPALTEMDNYKDTHEHMEVILLSSAYDSGFMTPTEKLLNPVFGFGVKKGVELLVESIPYVGSILKEGGAFVIEIYQGVQDVDFNKIDIITRARIRSKVIIDNTGENLKIYNLEGSPDIQTVAGSEVTLAEGTMVTVSDTGVISEVETFDVKEVEKEYEEILSDFSRNNSAGADNSDSKTGVGSSTWLIIGGLAIVIVALVVLVMRKRKKA